MRIFLIYISLVITWFGNASATDYYVRPSGGNYGLEDGSSYNNAWDGFLNIDWVKVDEGNGKLFIAGTHREVLLVGESGEEGTPLQIVSCTIDNGASTEAPGIVIGSNPVAIGSWTYSHDAFDYWWWDPPDTGFGGTEVEPMQVWENDIRLTHTDPLTGNGQWRWNSENTRVEIITTDGKLDDEIIEVGQRARGIGVLNKQYVTIDGIIVKKVAARGDNFRNPFVDSYGDYLSYSIYAGMWAGTCSNIIFKNCIVSQMGGGDYYDGSGGNATNWSSGIEAYNCDVVKVFNNTIYDGHCVGLDLECPGITEKKGIEAYDNYVYDIDGTGIWVPHYGGKIYNNNVRNTGKKHPQITQSRGIYLGGVNNIQTSVYKNYIESSGDDAIRVHNKQGSNMLIAYNLIAGYERAGIAITNNSDDVDIFNNTIYDTNASVGGIWVAAEGNSDVVIRNNIIFVDDQLCINMPDAATDLPVFSNNIYYRASAGNAFKWQTNTRTYADFGLWVDDSGDANSFAADPCFVNLGSDFHLINSSPAKDAGCNVGLAQDNDGTPVPQGSGVDIGAFEFAPTVIIDTIPPTGSVTINNGDDVTYLLNVLLSLSAADDGKALDSNGLMALSNDGVEWSIPEPYATGKIWTLALGAAEKTVYAKFCDAAGNWMTEPAEDKIIYEESQNTNPPPIGTVTINNNDYFTSSLTVFLTLLAIDDGRELDEKGRMTFSNDGEVWSTPEPYTTGKIWTLLPGEGEKTVYVKFCDAAGNWMTEPAQDRIYYEESEFICDDPQNLRPVSATASSEWLPRYTKNNAFDGNPLTAWSAFSVIKKDQFITLDLGEMKRLSGLNMYASRMFGTDFFPTDFQIEISRDNSTWASIGKEWGYTPPLQPPYADEWEFDGIDCRYVRITITKSKTLFLFLHLAQIAEIEVYGCDLKKEAPLIAAEAPAVSTSQEASGRIKLEYAPSASQEQLTAPGRPEVRFE